MYQFPDDLRRAYESSPVSMVYYQDIDGKAVPVLASDGFCLKCGVDREHVLDWIRIGMFERMHPDDVGMVSKVSDDFLQRKGPYDIVFRCRLGQPGDTSREGAETASYAIIHGVGGWQTMPDGTMLTVITYANLSSTQELIKKDMETYILSRNDRFYTDPLTGLPNINYLHEYGEEKAATVRAEGRTPYLIYTDLHSMQSYNNRYGFEEGNRLLQLTAETLKRNFSKGLVTRGTDDHFIIITWQDDPEVLERRLYDANKDIRKNAYGNTFGIRSGVCSFSENLKLTNALDHARHTMKQIENDMNREVAFFSQAADNAYWRNRYILENFDQALAKGWIRLFYQCLCRLESGKAAAFEGLARWIDPARGMISPAEFIPVLLRYHQLYKLDLYMFEQVCREIRIRSENALPLVPVSVNFSMQDFDHIDVAEEMNRLYEKYDIAQYVDKSYFIVEITEQDLARGADRFKDQLERIRENGYRIWLDDFGSGYSAFNMFSRFEFDLIKIDMDLLHHLDDHGKANRVILKELVYIAKKLGIHTLIEGVETEEQLSFIKEIGCELGQGFLFRKPESLDEILYRLGCGDKAQLCETPEEREEFVRKWFQSFDQKE